MRPVSSSSNVYRWSGSSKSGNPTKSPVGQITPGCSSLYLCSGSHSGVDEAQGVWIRTGLGECCREWSGSTGCLGGLSSFQADEGENSEILDLSRCPHLVLKRLKSLGLLLNPNLYHLNKAQTKLVACTHGSGTEHCFFSVCQGHPALGGFVLTLLY